MGTYMFSLQNVDIDLPFLDTGTFLLIYDFFYLLFDLNAPFHVDPVSYK